MHEQSYTNKWNTLEEMAKFLEIYNLLRLSHEETENLTRPIKTKAVEFVVKKSLNKENHVCQSQASDNNATE